MNNIVVYRNNLRCTMIDNEYLFHDYIIVTDMKYVKKIINFYYNKHKNKFIISKQIIVRILDDGIEVESVYKAKTELKFNIEDIMK